ncbi:hypothetical protein EYF80_052427 [Liparis tanakae]|uniref:Uncharacterized protein n=1 Tax=Liparis tanakae TaxID=230148 RepID=A0A4Z2F952_9TELE|nr:hypothetical protein EYF80_052427 [Liparis tanakae]
MNTYCSCNTATNQGSGRDPRPPIRGQLTSVWTMDRRCERISATRPSTSATSCSLTSCSRRSRAMKVPVRPTPALRRRSRLPTPGKAKSPGVSTVLLLAMELLD